MRGSSVVCAETGFGFCVTRLSSVSAWEATGSASFSVSFCVSVRIFIRMVYPHSIY